MSKKDLQGGGDLVYKCRRCGMIIKDTHSPNLMADVHMLVATGETDTHRKQRGINPGMIGSHICEDGNLGVTDFVGGEFDGENK